jgi:ribonuclease H2 subunit A
MLELIPSPPLASGPLASALVDGQDYGNVEYMLGIDEAGRGPVLGPMVYATAFCPVADEGRLRAMGFMDSKVLSEEKRGSLWRAMQDRDAHGFIGWDIRVISAEEISGEMLSTNRRSLNTLSFDAAIELIRAVLRRGVNVTQIFVDTVGDADRYQERLAGLFPQCTVVVEPKADSKFPIVSAASICAKVPRDELTRGWTFVEPAHGFDRAFGSGYPADEDTKGWLARQVDPVFGLPRFARFSWSTTTQLLDKRACAVAWPDDEEGGGAQSKMDAYFARPGDTRPAMQRHRVFKQRRLELLKAL